MNKKKKTAKKKVTKKKPIFSKQITGTSKELFPDYKKEEDAFYSIISELVPKRSTVKRKYKSKPFSVEGSLCFNGISVKITALPEDWKEFNRFYRESPEGIGHEIYFRFIFPALEELWKKPLPRGVHKNTHKKVEAIKHCTCLLYPLLSYWCKQNKKDYPDFFRTLVKNAKNEDYEDFIKNQKRQTYNAVALTAYCIDKIFGKSTDNLESFRIHYIANNKIVMSVHERLIKNRTMQEIRQLENNLKINTILKRLQLL